MSGGDLQAYTEAVCLEMHKQGIVPSSLPAGELNFQCLLGKKRNRTPEEVAAVVRLLIDKGIIITDASEAPFEEE